MPARKPRPRPAAAPEDQTTLQVVHPAAAGIDVHSDMHMVALPPGRLPDGPVRSFGATTADLRAIADWLQLAGVTTVAMESTGVYWIPLFELLEGRGFQVALVEPGQLAHCGARPKTDVLDAQWIQRLHAYGLLRASFRPSDAVLTLRSFWRQRQMIVRYAASHVQHMQKALEQMNVKLTEVVSSIVGVTGMLILRAILDGVRDPVALAKLRHEKCQSSPEQIARALEGTWRPEHLFALKQAFELYQFHQGQVTECDAMVAAELARLPARTEAAATEPKPRRQGRKANDLRFDAAGPLHRALGVDLTAIEGIDVATATVILGETGGDMGRFPTAKHFASWLGLCPRQHQSNRTTQKRGPRRGKNRVAHALRLAARSIGRTTTPLGLFYRRIKSRTGPAGAITATAHKLARLIYALLKHGTAYLPESPAAAEARQLARQEAQLRRRARLLGFDLVPQATPTPP